MILRYVAASVRACPFKPRRNRYGHGRCVLAYCRQVTRRLDRDLSHHHNPDQPHWLPLPATQLLPSHIVGIFSIVLLAIAVAALYVYRLRGAWRWIYVVSAISALYLNVFVGVVQSFQKIALLKQLAPTQSEAPFLVAQVAVLAIFIVIGVLAVRKFEISVAAKT
jgi:uncharacterized membrane protein SirB2